MCICMFLCIYIYLYAYMYIYIYKSAESLRLFPSTSEFISFISGNCSIDNLYAY